MKPLILALLLLFSLPQEEPLKQKIKTFRNSGRFSVKYDRFEDRTYVRVGPFFVGGTKAYFMRGFELNMYAVLVKDKQPRQSIYLIFETQSRDWKLLKTRELYVLMDGERQTFGEGVRDSDVGGYYVQEQIAYLIPADTFAKMAQAKKSELRIGTIELVLKDEHKEAFRDLLSLL